MMELTNQVGVNWFLNQIEKKPELRKTSFPRIISQTFDKPISNQSPLIQKSFVNVLSQKDIFFNLQ